MRGPAPTRDEILGLLDQVLKDDVGSFPADLDGSEKESGEL
ncbi:MULTISPECIES: hypothetical protein [unclassified Nonomuraea]